jgi:hypothetical protein
MTLQQITASDIASWDTLQDIADSFEKRGLKPRPNLGDSHELVLQLADDEFVTVVEGGPGESATDFKPENRTQHTNLVATNDYEEFTFITRVRSWEGQQHGRIKHQKLSFTKEQFQRESGEKNTVLQKLNSIEYGSSAAIYDTLYDTRQVVKEFYQQFESLRTDLVQEVSGIPDDRGDAKQRYVQVILDRMIFLYFIQEKRLLDRNPNYLHEQPAKVIDDGEDRYEQFYEPLFFDYIAEDKQNPEFGKLPYLNGGLFAKNPVEEEFEDAKLGDSAKKTNMLFDDILDFLADWNWNVDERLDIVDPKNLSPAVLGHIFEQTVNQKEMGAYYTPEEITGFMARRTVHPYLLDQLNESVGASYDEIDDVFGFIDTKESGESAAITDGGMITQQAPTENVNIGHVETLYHDILAEVKLLDPAVGSGAFLLAGQEVLLDLYMQCIEFFQRLEDKGKGWELSSRTREELETIASGNSNASLYAKRTIILNNLYGVDIDDGAVEICKLRLWLSMVADIEDEPGQVEPLPNIDFNIRQGNSLIGFTGVTEINQHGDAPLTNFGGGIGESIRDKYEDIIDAIKNHRGAETAADAAKWRKEAEQRLSSYRDDLNEKVLEEFNEAGIQDVTQRDIEDQSPFHWVLEFATEYANGGFDVVIGNPPWDVVKSDRGDFFSQYDPIFRQRMPNNKDSRQEELLNNPEIAEKWEIHKDEKQQLSEYFANSQSYKLQSPDVGGQARRELSALFLERIFDLVDNDGYAAQILPGRTFAGAASKDLREHLLNNCEINSIIAFENNDIFDHVHGQYKFGITTFKNSGETTEVKSIFNQKSVDILKNIEEKIINVPRSILSQYSPKAKSFPFVEHKEEVEILKKMIQYPPVGDEIEQKWYADVYKEELNRTRDSDRFIESKQEGDYPVLGGSNIYQFSHDDTFFDDLEAPQFWSVTEDKNKELSAKFRIREKAKRNLKTKLYNSFDGSGSQKGFVNELLETNRGSPLSTDDVLLDCTEYRIVYRHVTNSTNERTIIATVIPKGTVCHNALATIRPYKIEAEHGDLNEEPLHGVYERIYTDKELFGFLGLLNSIPFDYLMRTKVEENVVTYKFVESQMPRLSKGDEWFEHIWKRGAQLTCYGPKFSEMRQRLGGITPITEQSERRQTQAELDAGVFHAYGLSWKEAKFIIDNFHKVNNPRVMTQEYFETVLEQYEILSDSKQ